MSKTAALLVLSTCPDDDTAEHIAAQLVERRLAACVNILSGLRSVYLWQGQVESDAERLLLIKTTESGYPRVEAAIRELHPYELPEIIAVTVVGGMADYLSWIQQSVHEKQ